MEFTPFFCGHVCHLPGPAAARLNNGDNDFMKSHLFNYLSLWFNEIYIIEDEDRKEFIKSGPHSFVRQDSHICDHITSAPP